MTLNEEHLAFFFQLGKAITYWQHIEYALYGVLAAASGDKDSGNIYIAFFSIRDFRQKLKHIDEIISGKIEDPQHLVDWAKLYARIDRAAGGRNSLAHYWVLYFYDEKPGRRVCLVPRRGTLKRKQKVPAGTLCIRDISKLEFRFTALTNALHNFASRLLGRDELYPKELEQERPPLTLAELRHEIHAFAGSPPPSSSNKSLGRSKS
jgi:hypothetical protein